MSTKSKTKAASKTAGAAVGQAAETYEQAAETVTEQAEQVAETVKAQAEQVAEAVKAQAEKAGAAATQGYDDFAVFQKNGFEALVRAGEIMARGAESIGKEYFAFAQNTAAVNGEAVKAVLSAKSLKEAVELQSELVRTNFDKSVDESSKLSEMSIKIASEAFEPLQKQLSVAVEKSMKPLAV